MTKTIYDHMKEMLKKMEETRKELRKEIQDDNAELKSYLSELDISIAEFRQCLEEAKKAGIDKIIANDYTESNTNDETPLTKTELNGFAEMFGMKPQQVQDRPNQMKTHASEDKKHKKKSDISSMEESPNVDYGRKHTDITNEIKGQHTNVPKQKRKQVEQTFKKQQTKSNTQAQFDKLDAMYQEMFLKPQLTDEELETISDFYGVSITDVISQWKQRCLSEKEYQKHQKKRHKKSLFQRKK